MSLPMSVVIDQLKSTPDSVIPILASLHKHKANFSTVSKVDLKHLTSRTLNLCRLNDAYSIWCGINIIHVLADSSEIVGAEGLTFFAQLTKVLGSPHAQNGKVVESGIKCLKKLCHSIRGKPTLTREILTPHLSSVFTVLLERLNDSPLLVLTSLKELIQEHSTTSRPFANKLKTYLLKFVLGDQFLNCPTELRAQACSTLACLPVIEREAPEQHWLRDVNALISEVSSTLEIYASFINVKDDQETSSLLKILGRPLEDDEGLFPLLSIDINYPSTIFSISQRIGMLFELLQGYLTSATTFAVVVPIGRVLALIDLVCALNTRFITFKREIRDEETKNFVELSLTRCHCSALSLLRQLPSKFSASLVPHLYAVFATLELMVFLQNKRLNHAKILANETMIREVIMCTTSFLALTNYFTDHSLISRVVEAAVFLVLPRTGGSQSVNESEKVKLSNQSRSARKKVKRNAAVPLSDLLSHEHLFHDTVPALSRSTVLAFFESVIRKVPISFTHYNKILKFVIVEAVKQTDSTKHHHVSRELQQVLVASLLHPAPESASIFPIATTILPQCDTLSVLNSPRFPPLPVLVRTLDQDEEEEEEEDEKDEVDERSHEGLRSAKRFKAESKAEPKVSAKDEENAINEPLHATSPEITEANIFTPKPFKSLEENKEDVEEGPVDSPVTDEKAESENNEAVSTTTDAVDDVMESDGGSEIEIPDLDLDEDSDEEN